MHSRLPGEVFAGHDGNPWKWSAIHALTELRRCSGSQFDPAVIDAFCAVKADELAAKARQLVAEAVPG